ncbi:hypothetical protein Q8A67_017778 [Cirrhinus molitorella]|uniref:Uncharacterized protein n=1 Tax=Cirrhinus molitorella TaxID=172907 RepID=A0AA88TS03_9TELE|nr:hypothetical protein Q8A67_017778 [Cirrhinus molitorella]
MKNTALGPGEAGFVVGNEETGGKRQGEREQPLPRRARDLGVEGGGSGWVEGGKSGLCLAFSLSLLTRCQNLLLQKRQNATFRSGCAKRGALISHANECAFISADRWPAGEMMMEERGGSVSHTHLLQRGGEKG